ncbi:MAG: hypothetical protein GX886_09620, partial [Comamonadaceae bacterium]|nr:hypothetical protein [Comamonadaceae bacterium]
EDGERYTINLRKTRPVADYLALQRRYRHMSAEQVTALQLEIDAGWARLERFERMSRAEAHAGANAGAQA